MAPGGQQHDQQRSKSLLPLIKPKLAPFYKQEKKTTTATTSTTTTPTPTTITNDYDESRDDTDANNDVGEQSNSNIGSFKSIWGKGKFDGFLSTNSINTEQGQIANNDKISNSDDGSSSSSRSSSNDYNYNMNDKFSGDSLASKGGLFVFHSGHKSESGFPIDLQHLFDVDRVQVDRDDSNQQRYQDLPEHLQSTPTDDLLAVE